MKCPSCGFEFEERDGRAAQWCARFRFYKGSTADPYADSDEELPADAPGAQTFSGLPAVAAELHRLGLWLHGKADATVLSGLELDTLLHKLRGLRPTISRRKGNAVWRVSYSVGGVAWLARVDVVRVD